MSATFGVTISLGAVVAAFIELLAGWFRIRRASLAEILIARAAMAVLLYAERASYGVQAGK
jgi:hypothetical protein